MSGFLVLVNREHPVGADYEPDDLVKLKNVMPSSLVTVKGSDIEGDRTAANAMIEMFEAAKADGVTGWQISAGYRSYEYQQELFDEQVAEYRAEGFTQEKAVSATRNTVADPGASEHHTGLAFDITVPGVSFKGTEQSDWISEHCWEYGFILRYPRGKENVTGVTYEPWHYRYVGKDAAKAIMQAGGTLEEYTGAHTA